MRVPRTHAAAVVVGMAFYWPIFRNHYFGAVFSGDTSVATVGAVGAVGTISYLVLLLLVLVLAVGTALRSQQVFSLLSARRWMVPAVSILASFCALLMMLFGGANINLTVLGAGEMLHMAVVVISVMAFALYVLIITLAWGSAIAPDENRRTMFYLALSFFLSFVISLTTQLPEPLSFALPLLGPLVCGFAWYLLPRPEAQVEPFRSKLLKQTIVRTALVLILFLIIGSIIRGFFATGVLNYYPNHETMTRSSLSILLALVLALAVYFSSHNERLINILWIIFVLIFFTGLFIVAAFNATWWRLGSDVVVMSRTFLGFSLWIVLVTIAKEHRQNPILLFSVFFIPTDCVSGVITNYLIPFFGGSNSQISQEYTGVFALVMAFVLLIGSFVYLSTLAFRKGEGGGSGEISKPGSEVSGRSRKEICDEIAVNCKLTAREAEVLIMISQGHSAKKIAEILFISTSTTQSHMKRLYKKIGLHSRQMIIDTVHARMQGNQSSKQDERGRR